MIKTPHQFEDGCVLTRAGCRRRDAWCTCDNHQQQCQSVVCTRIPILWIRMTSALLWARFLTNWAWHCHNINNRMMTTIGHFVNCIKNPANACVWTWIMSGYAMHCHVSRLASATLKIKLLWFVRECMHPNWHTSRYVRKSCAAHVYMDSCDWREPALWEPGHMWLHMNCMHRTCNTQSWINWNKRTRAAAWLLNMQQRHINIVDWALHQHTEHSMIVSPI